MSRRSEAARAPAADGGPSGAAVRFEGVGKSFGDRRVLNQVRFQVDTAECFGLVGMNGAGKTTCIKGLLDLTDLDAGEVTIFGVSHVETRARSRLAYLPERFLPPYYLRGRDFLRYMARLRGDAYDEEAARAMCGLLDLDVEALGRLAREYSKGMAQKLGLASCFLSGMDLLVMDEPVSGLDPKARILVKQHMLRLRAEGRTLLFSTHMLSDVDELCDRVGILHGGRLRFVGTPAECREAYSADTLEEAYLRCIGEGDVPTPEGDGHGIE